MSGPEVFAVLTPVPNRYWLNTVKAFNHPHNARWNDTKSTDSREPTPALSPAFESEDDSARLVLKFEQLSHINEIQVGTDPKVCQILLKFRGVKAVSGRHYTITVRLDGSIYLEDRFSRFGTRVIYDGQEEQLKELHGNWMLAAKPSERTRWKEVIICTGNIACIIEFPNHVSGSIEYVKKLEIFRERNNKDIPLFNALDLHSNPTTAAPSQSSTPLGSEQQLYWMQEEIAKSKFGTIRKLQKESDKRFYVLKTIHQHSERKRKRDEEPKTADDNDRLKRFRKLMFILDCINHPNVLRVIDHGEDPHPYYIMPYFEHGTLQGKSLPKEMFPKCLLQILLALREFHKMGFVHMDVKEMNILIDDSGNLVLADPDLLRSEKDILESFDGSDGTPFYAAPETSKRNIKPYGKAVDIWSAAVCVLNVFNYLPRPDDFPDFLVPDTLKEWQRKWCKVVMNHFSRLVKVEKMDEVEKKIMDILKHMLVYNPGVRFTVDQCLKRGCENGLFRENRHGDIVLAEATELNTEVNTPASFSFNTSLDDEDEPSDPVSRSSTDLAKISVPLTVSLREILANTEDQPTTQRKFHSFPDSTESTSDNGVSAFGLPSSTHESLIPEAQAPPEIPSDTQDNNPCDMVVPTVEYPEKGGKGAMTQTSSNFENNSSSPPAHTVVASASNASNDWSQTIGLEFSSSECGFPLGDMPTENEEKVLSKLRIKKDKFSSDMENSFPSEGSATGNLSAT